MSWTLNDVFNRVLKGERVLRRFESKTDYEVLRTSLLRKWRKANEAFEKCGFERPFEGKFFRCTWNSETSEGAFLLDTEARKSHSGKPKVYGLKDV